MQPWQYLVIYIDSINSISMFYRLVFILSYFTVITESNPAVWAPVFPGPTCSQEYMKLECSHNGHPVCCGILNDDEVEKRNTYFSKLRLGCKTKRVYTPSPFEMHNFDLVKQVDGLSSDREKKNMTNHILRSKELANHSKKWLKRVAVRMNNASAEITSDDKYYLSHFHVTATCGDHKRTWVEWIEPLIFQFRHPFAFTGCPRAQFIASDTPPSQIQVRVGWGA